MYDLEKFKTGKYFIHTPTQEDFNNLMEYLEENGFVWGYSNKPTSRFIWWEEFKEETCVSCSPEKLGYCYREYYLEEADKKELKPLTKPDMIKQPPHYIGEHGLEVEEVLQNFLPRFKDPYIAHRVGSMIEYILRSPLKNGIEDLEKACYNATQVIKYMKEKENE